MTNQSNSLPKKKRFHLTTKQMTRIAILAALQVVLAYVLAPIMFGPLSLYVTGVFNPLIFVWGADVLWAAVIATMLNNLLFGGGFLQMLWAGIPSTLLVFGTLLYLRKKKTPLWLAIVASCVVSGLTVGPMIGLTTGLPAPAWLLISAEVTAGDIFVQICGGIPLVYAVRKMQKYVPALKEHI